MTLTPFIKLHGNAKDLTGCPFGRLTVLGPVRKTKHSQIVWLCKCECCNFATVVGGSLRSGATKSCGCLHRETARQNHTSHGLRNTLEYGAWARIKSRCYNPRHKSFNRHGGRGITMAAEWRDDFQLFFDHIGPRPSPKHNVDRIDNDKGYEPGNVRWATDEQLGS
tara:strand:- start:83 stop:580 length:498 start_codon:yes stop_codon:yes gene_type:complete